MKSWSLSSGHRKNYNVLSGLFKAINEDYADEIQVANRYTEGKVDEKQQELSRDIFSRALSHDCRL